MALNLGEIRFRDLCALFLEDRAKTCVARTLRAYEKACRLILEPTLGEHPLGHLTRQHVLDAHAWGRDARGPAAANVGIVVGRMVWTFAEHLELVGPARNPFMRVRPWPTPQRRNPETPDQARELYLVLEDALTRPGKAKPCSPVHAGYFLLVLMTGLRMREATHLRHEEFDRTGGRLVIRSHKTVARRGQKVIKLADDGTRHLARLQDDFPWDEVFFFPSPRSARGHIEDPWRPWQRVLAAAGVEGVTIHDLRRGFACMVLNAGGELRTLQSLLGHASIATTAKYAVPNADLQTRAANSATSQFVVPLPTAAAGGDGEDDR